MFLRRRFIILLFAGDVFFLYISIFPTIVLRDLLLYGNQGDFLAHLFPFSFLIAMWAVVFLVAGLYDKETLFFRHKLPAILFNAQLVNGVIGIAFFYFAPFFLIAPKTNLFVYTIVSFILLLLWRFYGVQFLTRGKNQKALIVGSNPTLQEVARELEYNTHHGISVLRTVALDGALFSLSDITKEVPTKGISVVIIDMNNPKIETIMPQLYNLLFAKVRFFDLTAVYEELFDRIPLSLIYYQWFLKNVSQKTYTAYDVWKRGMDILLSLLLGIPSLVFYPCIAVAIALETGRPVIIKQKRIGERNKIINLYKFRSMERNEDGVWVAESGNKITTVGGFLRKTRLDELPQIWNIVRGDLSFVGPRPDIVGLGEKLLKEIPYYNIRYTVKPGLSGWAQIKQDIVPQSVEESKERLAYDLYYIKNRSFMLDVFIALKTVKTILSRTGR